jgi:hypothetical protein
VRDRLVQVKNELILAIIGVILHGGDRGTPAPSTTKPCPIHDSINTISESRPDPCKLEAFGCGPLSSVAQ